MGKRIFKSVLHVAPPPHTAAPTPASAWRADFALTEQEICANVAFSGSPALELTFLAATLSSRRIKGALNSD